MKQLYPMLEEYVSHWNWPNRLKGTEKHANSVGEGLSVYPELAYWVAAVGKMLIAGGSALVGCFRCIC